MTRANWFSARLRYAILVEAKGLDGYMDSVFIFQSSDFDNAFQRALAVGRAQEREYLNGEGNRVRWRLASVVSLDVLPDLLDGAEVYSEPVPANGGEIPFNHQFSPEESKPTQTL
jgi:hypothetical protein